MRITVLFSYKGNHIHDGNTMDDGKWDLEVPEFTSDEVPIAFVAKHQAWLEEYGIESIDYRYYDYQFWTSRRLTHNLAIYPVNKQNDTLYEMFPTQIDLRRFSIKKKTYPMSVPVNMFVDASKHWGETWVKIVEESPNKCILIDGQVYMPSPEPFYQISNWYNTDDQFTSKIIGSNYGFTMEMAKSILQLEELIQIGNARAHTNRNHKSIPMQVDAPRFEIHIPTSLKYFKHELSATDYFNQIAIQNFDASSLPSKQSYDWNW